MYIGLVVIYHHNYAHMYTYPSLTRPRCRIVGPRYADEILMATTHTKYLLSQIFIH